MSGQASRRPAIENDQTAAVIVVSGGRIVAGWCETPLANNNPLDQEEPAERLIAIHVQDCGPSICPSRCITSRIDDNVLR